MDTGLELTHLLELTGIAIKNHNWISYVQKTRGKIELKSSDIEHIYKKIQVEILEMKTGISEMKN